VTVPYACPHWWLMPRAEDALLGFSHCEGDTASVAGDDKTFIIYSRPMVAKLIRLDGLAAMVSVNGRASWVHRDLLKPDRSGALAREKAEREKELAFIATLPKSVGPAAGVLVATSQDCAKDLQKLADFAKSAGTGVEFRKKVADFLLVGCGMTMPTGTPLIVSRKDSQFVEFGAYSGPHKGTHGVALSKDVK
jgi:hypothetical protein